MQRINRLCFYFSESSKMNKDALLFAYRHLNTDLFLAWLSQHWNGKVPIGKLMLSNVLPSLLTYVFSQFF